MPIPPDGLRLVVSNAPAAIASIHGIPSYGAQADQPTPFVAITNLGAVAGPVTTNLSGKGVLIQRSPLLDFYQQINYAAWAGATFAVIYDDQNEPRVTMPKTDFAAIPAMLVTQSDGAALAAYLQTNAAQPVLGRMTTLNANVSFNITSTLSCEHVHLLVYTDCPNRSGMRIVLTSPAGTRSVMQHLNQDTSAGPYEWTYTSVGHFFEGSYGTWQAAFSYEQPGTSGNVQYVSLWIDGVSIVDTDHDGLDDRWETAWFGNLSPGPKETPAGDGWPNSVKQILGVNPKIPLFPFILDLSLWNTQWARLAWPGVDGGLDEIFSLGGSPPIAVPGRFSQSEYFIDYTAPMGFYYIRRP
jgi:subtilisin-like proprotein convertase family protein